MPLWKKLWLLFTVLWVLVGLLHVATILALEDPVASGGLWLPVAITLVGPPIAYLLAWLAVWLRARGGQED